MLKIITSSTLPGKGFAPALLAPIAIGSVFVIFGKLKPAAVKLDLDDESTLRKVTTVERPARATGQPVTRPKAEGKRNRGSVNDGTRTFRSEGGMYMGPIPTDPSAENKRNASGRK